MRQVCRRRGTLPEEELMFTANLEFPRSAQVFGDPQLTGALLDHITHQCHLIECHGDSYRFKQSLKKRHAVT